MIKKIIIAACGLGLGFGVLGLESCKSERKINMVLPDLTGQAPVPMFHNGDVLTWHDAQKNQMTANFRIFSPCKEGPNVTTCTINVPDPGGSFNYYCNGDPNKCPDPEVPVGSDYGTLGNGRRPNVAPSPQRVATTFANPVDLYCNSNVSRADPVTQTANVNQAFDWESIGPAPPDWQVTFASGQQPCSQPGPFNKTNHVCTPKARGGTYPYTVKITGCGPSAAQQGPTLIITNNP